MRSAPFRQSGFGEFSPILAQPAVWIGALLPFLNQARSEATTIGQSGKTGYLWIQILFDRRIMAYGDDDLSFHPQT